MGHVARITYDECLNRLAASKLCSYSIDEIGSFGCFVLSDCLCPALVENVHLSLQQLFALPDSEKQMYRVDKIVYPLGPGYSPYGVARATDTGTPNLLETWDISPTQHAWPKHLPQEWRTIMAYQHRLHVVSKAALRYLALCLGASVEGLVKLLRPIGIHLIHYFPLKAEPPESARRQSEHYDNTLVTLIPPHFPEDDGLQVYDRASGNWENVNVGSTECLVQIGLILEYVTGQSVRAALHTVATPKVTSPANRSRYSTPYFVSPLPHTIVSLLPGLRTAELEKQFPDISIELLQREYFAKIFRP